MITWCLCFLEICSAIPTTLHFQCFCILYIILFFNSLGCEGIIIARMKLYIEGRKIIFLIYHIFIDHELTTTNDSCILSPVTGVSVIHSAMRTLPHTIFTSTTVQIKQECVQCAFSPAFPQWYSSYNEYALTC